MLAVVMVIYVSALSRGLAEPEVRALTFTTIVAANLCLILTNRSWSDTLITSLRTPNRALLWVFAGTIVSLLLVLYVPVLQNLFRFGTLSLPDLGTCLAAGALSVALQIQEGQQVMIRINFLGICPPKAFPPRYIIPYFATRPGKVFHHCS